MLTNATLRHRFGLNPSYEGDSDLKRRIKSVTGRVLNKSGLTPNLTKPDMVTFRVDENAEGFIVDVEPFERSFSIYWVIKGNILCRNRIVALEETTKNGHRACGILMDPELIPVLPKPRRAFQGWRYLQDGDQPADVTSADSGGDLPAAFRAKLIDLGAW